MRPALALSRLDVAIKGLAECRSVPLRQVDLVAGAVQGERHRLNGWAAVEIIDQLLDHFSRHVQNSLSTEGVHNLRAGNTGANDPPRVSENDDESPSCDASVIAGT